jgi:glutamate N-acetyltransferase / amino-acid N-acetyltransferase
MSIVDVPGFSATGQAVGIKGGGRLDAALIVADVPALTAGVFTQNKAAAAPVQITKKHLAASNHQLRGVLVTSGNANAATGQQGLDDAIALCQDVAAGIGCDAHEIAICQTGLIGIPFPLTNARPGIQALPQFLGSTKEDGERAAHAILTTDTFVKEATIVRDGFTLGAIAKGAAMLAPNMATMLSVITTDAALDHNQLERALATAVAGSFNSMVIDGATSTNDTVLVLSSGTAKNVDERAFTDALSEACLTLAEFMTLDAEGATKAVRVHISGAASNDEAHQGAVKVANSLLVKCSLNGEDPYWGRVLSEVATAGIECDPNLTTISYGGIAVSRGGVAIDHDASAVAAHLAERWNSIEIDLGLGTGVASILTTDLGHGYIDENRTTS